MPLSSLPSRERGLKLENLNNIEMMYGSLPSRERGLKFSDEWIVADGQTVAPLAGAWIEMDPVCSLSCMSVSSLPSRERGLK